MRVWHSSTKQLGTILPTAAYQPTDIESLGEQDKINSSPRVSCNIEQASAIAIHEFRKINKSWLNARKGSNTGEANYLGFVSASVTWRMKIPSSDVPCHPFHTYTMMLLQAWVPSLLKAQWGDAGGYRRNWHSRFLLNGSQIFTNPSEPPASDFKIVLESRYKIAIILTIFKITEVAFSPGSMILDFFPL